MNRQSGDPVEGSEILKTRSQGIREKQVPIEMSRCLAYLRRPRSPMKDKKRGSKLGRTTSAYRWLSAGVSTFWLFAHVTRRVRWIKCRVDVNIALQANEQGLRALLSSPSTSLNGGSGLEKGDLWFSGERFAPPAKCAVWRLWSGIWVSSCAAWVRTGFTRVNWYGHEGNI